MNVQTNKQMEKKKKGIYYFDLAVLNCNVATPLDLFIYIEQYFSKPLQELFGVSGMKRFFF